MLMAAPGELFISCRHDELCGSQHRVFRFELATKNKIARLLFRKRGHNPLRPRRPNRVLGKGVSKRNDLKFTARTFNCRFFGSAESSTERTPVKTILSKKCR